MGNKTIVAIGGGHLKTRETENIDKHIISLAGTKNPKVLFIPTASLDEERYIKTFTKVYSENGCKVETLLITKDTIPRELVDDKILGSNIIYVGGGNTLYLYNLLRYHGIDLLLKKAWDQGIVLSGLSAGCIIWHERGLTDSIHKKFVCMGGLGFVPRFCTPHYLRERKRRAAFHDIIIARGYEGIAIDDMCAVVYNDRDIKEVISLGENYDAYLVNRDGEGISERRLEKTLIDHKKEPRRIFNR